MADNRNSLDRHLRISEQDYLTLPYARHQALMEHVGQALESRNYAAAQVYATLLVAEGQNDTNDINVNLTNWEDLAIGIGNSINNR